jgi:hypothetical protein
MQLCGWIAVFELPGRSLNCCGCLGYLQSCVAQQSELLGLLVVYRGGALF